MNKIQEIHESDLFGIVVESGCSATLSSALMEVAGSSNTIYKCEIPYNKEYQEYKYGKFKRSVSKEWIEAVLNKEYYDYIETGFKPSKEINFIFASSWQLIDPVDPLVYAHGWFGLFDIRRNQKHYLHFTFRRDLFNRDRAVYGYSDRKNLLAYISNHAVDILHSSISGNIDEITSSESKILDMAYINDDVNYHLLINTLEKANGDYFLVFDKGDVIRIEDLMRKSNEFIIQKGSYEILHHGHLTLMKESLDKYTKSFGSFLISLYRYDKPHLSSDDIIERISPINQQGFPVIICKSVLFYETFDLLRKWSHNKKFYFPIGIDTLNRISQTDLDNKVEIKGIINNYKNDFKFLLFNRLNYERDIKTYFYDDIINLMEYTDDGISSTAIKQGKMKNSL
jgi:nicotinic acid mononucleotide adenylyltransferase